MCDAKQVKGMVLNSTIGKFSNCLQISDYSMCSTVQLENKTLTMDLKANV